MKKLILFLIPFLFSISVYAQPEDPVEEWTGKTVLVVGAHPDDGAHAYGTLSLLKQNKNEIFVLLLTTGNVGTKDPDMTRERLAEIRRHEEIRALKALGIPEDHYINLGYTDGMLEYANKKEVVKRIVRHIRKLKPDVLFTFDPGYGYQTWHKTDHRSASYLAVDAARVAEWRLLFQGQIIHEGLEPHRIKEYMFFDGVKKDKNTWVDISGHVDAKKEALKSHISQFSSNWKNYKGPDPEDLAPEDRKAFLKRIDNRIHYKDETPVEGFRYYKGIPDGAGRRK